MYAGGESVAGQAFLGTQPCKHKVSNHARCFFQSALRSSSAGRWD